MFLLFSFVGASNYTNDYSLSQFCKVRLHFWLDYLKEKEREGGRREREGGEREREARREREREARREREREREGGREEREELNISM